MPKFTREFIQKVQDKAKEFDFSEESAPDQVQHFEEIHGDYRYDPNAIDNDEVLIEFLALAHAGIKDDKSAYSKAFHFFWDLNEKIPDNDISSLMRFLDYKINLNEIESIENGKLEYRVKQPIEVDDNIVINNGQDNPANNTNDVFDKNTVERAKGSLHNLEGLGHDLLNFEYNHRNDKLTVYSALKTKLGNLTPSAVTPDMLDAHRDDAQQLLSIYAALQQRSEERTIGDIIKHPFKTFAEWIMKGKVKNTLENKYGINDKQLKTLTGIVQDNADITNYHELTEEGNVLDFKGAVIYGDVPKLNYDELGKDTNLESEISSDTDSVVSSEEEKVREEEPDMFV